MIHWRTTFQFLKVANFLISFSNRNVSPHGVSPVTEVSHLPKYATSPFTVFIFRKIPVQHMFNFLHDFKEIPPLCLSYSSASEQEIKKWLKILVSWDVTLYWNSITPPKTCIFSSNNVKPGSCKEKVLWRKCVGVTWTVTEWERSFESGNIEGVSAQNSNSWNPILTSWHNKTTL